MQSIKYYSSSCSVSKLLIAVLTFPTFITPKKVKFIKTPKIVFCPVVLPGTNSFLQWSYVFSQHFECLLCYLVVEENSSLVTHGSVPKFSEMLDGRGESIVKHHEVLLCMYTSSLGMLMALSLSRVMSEPVKQLLFGYLLTGVIQF